MTPERLQSWIYRPVTGSSTLSLTYEPTLGQSSVVATWTRDEVEQTRESNGSQGEEVLTAARDYIEQLESREACKFVLAWYGERRADPLRSMPFKLKPEETPAAPLSPFASAAANSDNALLAGIVSQLLGHIAQTHKVTNASQGIVLAAYERALNMQQRTADDLQKSNEQLRGLLSMLSDTEKNGGELADVKARALDKLVQALPAVVNMGVQLATATAAAPKPSREQRMSAARDALGALEPSEIAALVAEDEPANGESSDEPPQH